MTAPRDPQIKDPHRPETTLWRVRVCACATERVHVCECASVRVCVSVRVRESVCERERERD